MPKGIGEAQGKITGKLIIEQLVRNMELGQFEMGYSVLVPCIFSLYLHPDDYTRLTGVFDLIREDARRALTSRLEQLNAKPLGLGVIRGGKDRKPYKIASKDWTFEFFPDSEGAVPLGDVEIHSDLNETPQPGYHGAKTTLLEREPSVGAVTGVSGGVRPETRQSRGRVSMRKSAIRTTPARSLSHDPGRDQRRPRWKRRTVNLALYTNDEVSREHLAGCAATRR